MNEKLAEEYISKAYRTVRIVKEIQRGNRAPAAISEKTNSPLNLVHYYLKALTTPIERE